MGPVPRVLFLPGVAGAAAFWQPAGARLPASWTSHYLSWPGLGNEPADPGVTGFDDLVAIVERRLDAPSDLVAQSMGGVVAARVAIAHPDRVRRLVLVATSGGLDVSGLGGADWREAYRDEYPGARSWATDGQPDLTGQLGAITAPTLLVWGDADPISPPAVGRHLLATLPNATLEIIRGGTHAMAVERPAEVAALIEAHLR
jgi:pimeloyl-ACP methyl ester carboxylesterase